LFLHYLVLHAQDFLIFKEKRRFFREAIPFRGMAAGRSEWIFSGISHKIDSSVLVNILQKTKLFGQKLENLILEYLYDYARTYFIKNS